MGARVVHQGQGGAEGLPPAGDAQRDELKQRTDALLEQAETSVAEGGAIREDAFDIENEIAQHFDADYGLKPPNANENWVYCWVFRDPAGKFGNRFFMQKMAEGWERVLARDPDAVGMEHCIHPDGSLTVGDVILLRIRKDHYIRLVRRQRELTRRVEQGVKSELENVAGKYGVRIFDEQTIDTVRPGMGGRQVSQMAAAEAAERQFDTMIREGRVPGSPAPRRR